MDLSLSQLEQAVSIRRQIDALERRFAGLVGGGRISSSSGARVLIRARCLRGRTEDDVEITGADV
jgi:hypothetical protein